jgi:hypothetical protein
VSTVAVGAAPPDGGAVDAVGDEPAGVGDGGADESVTVADGAGVAEPGRVCVSLGVLGVPDDAEDGDAGVEALAEELAASLASALVTWPRVSTWPPVPVMP